MPFALKEAIEQELNCLEQDGIIEKISYSPWAAPLVPVPKGVDIFDFQFPLQDFVKFL